MIFTRIIGTGSYLPEHRMDNHQLAEKVETSDEWIVSRTGIKARHIAADNEQSSDLATQAALRAIENAQIDKNEIDLIILATSTPDHIFPSTACIVQHKLGINNQCPAFDVQAVCAGFIYALITAQGYIQSGMAKKVLVIGAETFSRIIDWQDRRTCVLFGDGAGAMVLSADEQPGIIHSKLCANGAYAPILQTPGKIAHGLIEGSPFLHMDGQAVFKFAVKALAEIGKQVIAGSGLNIEDIDRVVPHQANQRIVEATAKSLGIPMDKIMMTVHEHGNTSAASIPLAFDEGVRSGYIQRNHKILIEGIGGGFAWGASVLQF